MHVRRFAFIAILLSIATAAFADEARTAAELARVRNSPPELRRFVEALPKGGDLHNHLSGATYAESFIAWGAADGLCINTTTFGLVSPPCDGTTQVPASKALTDSTLYGHALDRWRLPKSSPARGRAQTLFFRS